MSRLLALTYFIFLSCAAFASETPVIYNKTTISILPKAQPLPPPKEPHEYRFEVEVRAAQIPANQGMFIDYGLSDKRGLMTFYSISDNHSLIAENLKMPVDVLFIRKDGIIMQIIPNLHLSALEEDIATDNPFIALLFLKTGLSEQWKLAPGDRVKHGMFIPRPTVHKIEEP